MSVISFAFKRDGLTLRSGSLADNCGAYYADLDWGPKRRLSTEGQRRMRVVVAGGEKYPTLTLPPNRRAIVKSGRIFKTIEISW